MPASFDSTLAQKERVDAPVKRQKVLVLAGPTAVGKTDLSLRIAKTIGGEVISADSMQVYRGMDIGTAKATPDERKDTPHHLIDSRDLDEPSNVVQFYEEAKQSIREISSKGGVPIIVGGTGFYIHALLYGPPRGPASHPELRKKLEKEIDLRGPEALYDQLCQIDPIYAASITLRDRQKIVRAIEIITLSHSKVSELPPHPEEKNQPYDFRCWFLHLPKDILYERIEKRCEQMIAAGFVEEVRKLQNLGLENNSTASQAIGYRQCLDFLKSPQTNEDWNLFIHSFKTASRRYAKRQFTWFRKEPLFRWLNIDGLHPDLIIETILQDFENRL